MGFGGVSVAAKANQLLRLIVLKISQQVKLLGFNDDLRFDIRQEDHLLSLALFREFIAFTADSARSLIVSLSISI